MRRSTTRRAAVAWGIALVDLFVFIWTLWFWSANGGLVLFEIATFIALPVAFGGVGAFLTVRVPGNPIGPLLLTSTTGLAVLVGVQAAVPIMLDLGVDATLVALLGLIPSPLFIPSLLIVLVGIPLIFPTGRMLSRRWWALVILTIAVVLPVELAALVATTDVMEVAGLVNPLGNADLEAFLVPFEALASIAAIPILFAAFASLVIRYRRSDDIGRHQIRWLAAAIMVAVVAFSISFNAPAELRSAADSFGIAALTFIPLAIGVAVVRYRLYEIDRLISRGISYALVTILLVAAYAAVVLVLQGPLGGVFGEGTVPVAISTLVVASLFQPVRQRVQRMVDRRFDRARVDGERISVAFSERLRDEVDIDAVVRDLAGTVDATVRPIGVQLWLREARD